MFSAPHISLKLHLDSTSSSVQRKNLTNQSKPREMKSVSANYSLVEITSLCFIATFRLTKSLPSGYEAPSSPSLSNQKKKKKTQTLFFFAQFMTQYIHALFSLPGVKINFRAKAVAEHVDLNAAVNVENKKADWSTKTDDSSREGAMITLHHVDFYSSVLI